MTALRVAFSDPPYIGQAHRYPEKTEVDHREHIAMLLRDFPDGWALSCSVPSLHTILDIVEGQAAYRIGAWVKPWAVFKPNVNPGYAWETVIFVGGRKRTREQDTVRDWVAANVTLRTGMVGAKPLAFCYWVFAFLGLEPGDTLVDLFPGSGGVTRAWAKWRKAQIEASGVQLSAWNGGQP